MSGRATVGIDNHLPTGQTGITNRTAHHETPRWIDDEFEVVVWTGQNGLQHMLAEIVVQSGLVDTRRHVG